MALTKEFCCCGGANSNFIGKNHPDFVWKRHPDYGKQSNPTYDHTLQEVVDSLIENTNLNPEDVDRLFVGNFTGELCKARPWVLHLLVPTLLYYLQHVWKSVRGDPAILVGLDAIAGGADIVLVAGVEVQTTVSARRW